MSSYPVRCWRLLNVTHVIAPEMLEPDLSPVAPITESVMPGDRPQPLYFV
ncbi:MAG: hypothetical protein R3C44_11440 [Chloroflexota bacterium]